MQMRAIGPGAQGDRDVAIDQNRNAAEATLLQGLTYDAQWWVRDAAAPGGISRSDFVRVTIE